MNKKEALRQYKEYRSKLAAYNLVLSTTYFDKETVAPKGGNNYRNEKLAFMAGELYQIETDPKIIEVIEYLSHLDLGQVMNREIYLASKSLESVTKFSKEEVMDFDLLCSKAWDAWYEGKKTNNYALFAPYLKQLCEVQKQRSKRRNPNKNPYDVALDDYEEGMTMEDYDKFFSLIKTELLPLIKKVNDNQQEVDDSFLFKYYPLDKQKKFVELLLKHIGYDSSWGYLGISEHPFTDGLSKYDVRTTTAYDEYSITRTIFSIIHEVGHAYFEHQVDAKYDDMMVRYCISSGMHESQSRFLENYIGKKESFWVKLYPKLQRMFKKNLKDVSLDQFIRAINASRSSLVRTEADELTYPIHILIRYEIEKGIFDGSISTDNLDKVWNEKYKEYLGIDVPSDTEGILQDVHWSGASFGYFPTYALGSAIGAQLLKTMESKVDVDGLLSKGKFKLVEKWLKDNIQHNGALYDYNKILMDATGEKFNPQYYIDYLKDKYTKLYNLQEK